MALGAAACVVLVLILAGRGPRQADLWVGILGALAGVVAAVAAVWPLIVRPSPVLPAEVEVPRWVVDRPAELSAVTAALAGGRAGAVGITTA